MPQTEWDDWQECWKFSSTRVVSYSLCLHDTASGSMLPPPSFLHLLLDRFGRPRVRSLRLRKYSDDGFLLELVVAAVATCTRPGSISSARYPRWFRGTNSHIAMPMQAVNIPGAVPRFDLETTRVNNRQIRMSGYAPRVSPESYSEESERSFRSYMPMPQSSRSMSSVSFFRDTSAGFRLLPTRGKRGSWVSSRICASL